MDASSVKPNFSFGLVAFDDRVTHQRAPEPIAGIDYLSQSFDPTAHSVTGGTSIYEGLEAAYGLTRDWLAAEQGTLPVTAVIAVLTDGECSNPARTRDLAERIKAEEPRISIAAGMFATKGQGMPGTQLLQAIVTEPRLYAVIYSSEQLREWFHASLTGTGLAARKAQ
jgi:hypothetical protein